MAALLISLKLRLVRNGWRASLAQRVSIAVGAVFGLLMTAFGTAGVVALRAADARWAAFGVIVAGSGLVLGWALVPLLVAGVDETLDPARFALLPLRARDLAPGLLLAGVVGIPGAATTVLAAATLVTWSRGAVPLLLAVPSAALGVLTCILGSRLVTTAAARLLAARRSREVGAVLAVLLMSSASIWPAVLSHRSLSTTTAARVADALAWTPLGLPWAAPADAATGHPVRGLLRLALAAAVVAAGVGAWSRLLDRALVERTDGGGTRASVGLSLLDRLPGTPVWAVAARSLRYWRRDPRYLVAGAAVTVSGTMPLIAVQIQAHRSAVLLGAAPLVGTLLGITTANDLGTDGSAFATHLLAGVPGRVDRLGRALAVLCWAVPLLVAVSLACALGTGRPALFPAALGAALEGLLAGLGAAAIAAPIAPYPVPAAGSNPFRSSSGASARAALAQLVVMSVTGTATLPGVALLLVAAAWWPPAAWVALVAGPVIGVGMLAVGVVVGGRALDARGPEVLAVVRRPL